jgi:hypothetical protein
MKTSIPLILLALGLAALPLTGARAAPVAVDPAPETLWTPIKDDTYGHRAHFEAGVNQLSAKLDDQIRTLRAKRAAMTTDTKDWDFVMKEVDMYRSLLTSRMTDLTNATTPEAWGDAKEKIDQAWHGSQTAVDKMNTTRTS